MYRFACALGIWLPVAFVGTARAEVPATLSHQGVIAVGGERFTGAGDFRFALVDPVSGEYLWTNDDSPLANCTGSSCVPPVGAVALNVINGVFDVALGDSGMFPIDASIFEMPGVALRVWFDDRKHGTHQLVPDQGIDSVAFAFRTATIDDNAVSSIKIADGQVSNVDLANNAVNSAKIQDGAVTAADLANDSVAAAEIAAGAVGTSEIADGSVGNVDLANNAVNGATIQDASITAADLAIDSVAAAEIAAGAVGTSEIADGSVGNVDLANNAVNGATIQDASITAADLANDSVAAAEIAAGAVGTSEIADLSVGNVDIASNAIDGAKVSNNSLTDVDLFDEAGVASNTIAGNLTLGQSFSSMVSQTISVPASGFVLAIGSVDLLVNSGPAIGVIGLSTSSNSLDTNGNEYRVVSSGPVSLHDLIAVSAGSTTIHFVGSNAVAAISTLTASSRHLSLVYFPTSYGTVSVNAGDAPIAWDDEHRDADHTGEFEADRDEPGRIPPAPAALDADELLQRLAVMEERIAELERLSSDSAP